MNCVPSPASSTGSLGALRPPAFRPQLKRDPLGCTPELPVSPASNWPGIAAERFANQCREIIAPFLDEYGFRCVRDHVTPNSASLSFANDDRYVALSLSFDPRDAPHACRVILGEGSLEMPECDWNGIGLWRLVDEPRTNPVEIKGIDDVDSALAEVLMQLQQAAPDFLRG